MLKEESSGERLRRTEESQGEEMRGSGTLDPGDLMETSPVSEEAAIHPGIDPGRVIEACSLCEALMDVTDQPPLSQFRCPNCGQRLRVHRQFKNYRLLEFLGEGGMGWVYKAVDRNLNREIALKILKKECRATAGECATLEREARITASIDHPHVIKVFSFGEDQGQFYLAMELAEKGSLVDLMRVQPRLAEAQVLQVGIQIAKGLDAALEHNLIHRDIKPGNILFSDPDTAKLVDFGLAIFMDEVAHAEAWGTAYYVAPEKMDDRPDRPEDFRSDIYSLGGTLFHALAGRPPHTGGGPITVALKQLMSQPVSLLAFAPHVSSETAYVINRMLAKDPAKRYASYPELIEHLSYARTKLLERSKRPCKAKERLVIDTFAMKNVPLSLGGSILIASILAACFLGSYIFFETSVQRFAPVSYSDSPLEQAFRSAVRRLGERQPAKALAEFDRLLLLANEQQPMKNWIRMNGALAALVAGEEKNAAKRFQALAKEGIYSIDEDDRLLASFFVEASKQLAKPDKKIPASITRLYSNTNFEAFGLLCFGLHNWRLGDVENARAILGSFLDAKIPDSDTWIEELKPLAADYSFDCEQVATIKGILPSVNDPASAQALLEKTRKARQALKIGGKMAERLESIERQLIAQGARP